jgi:hypothetical protein
MNVLSPSPFQVLLLVCILMLLVASIVALIRGWTGRQAGVVWIVICLAAGVAILWPDSTSVLARALGIGRGADLVFYCAIVVLLFGIWMMYVRLRRVRREITLLVRHVALLEAEREAAAKSRKEAAPQSPQSQPTEEADSDAPA